MTAIARRPRTATRPLVTTPPDGKAFWCQRGCGDTWDTDPRLAVACPKCGAAAGAGCCRPSEHAGNFVTPHAERRRLAFELRPCRCLELWDAEHATAAAAAPAQPDLFAGMVSQ